jgi:hypothetical protein
MFKREVHFRMPYDKRHKDPNKDYGIGTIVIRMILIGEKGAVQFVFNTGMRGWDVGYHAKVPQYDEQTSMECTYLEQGHCYYDGSSLMADDWMREWLASEEDEEFIWKRLEEYYRDRFVD